MYVHWIFGCNNLFIIHLPENIHPLKRQTIQVNPEIDDGIRCVKLVGFGIRPICVCVWCGGERENSVVHNNIWWLLDQASALKRGVVNEVCKQGKIELFQ